MGQAATNGIRPSARPAPWRARIGGHPDDAEAAHPWSRIARLLQGWALLAAALAITGCAQLDAGGGADEAEARRELEAGIALYEKGDYVNTIRSLLTAREIWAAPVAMRVTAQKYVAFSHCLLDRPEPCKQSFKDLLRLKPDFELAAAEAGHPMWSSAFEQAKRESAAPSHGLVAQTKR